MGFIAPSPPPFELEQWQRLSYLSRLKPLAQDWAVNGFGTPTAIFLVYALKLVVFALGGFLIISAATPGLGGLGDFSHWWTQPIVFEKVAVWVLLWEVLGLGCGSMPLTLRFIPPIGGCLYWLRPGTVRLPPWPGKVPLTAGTRRAAIDVALYAGVLASAIYLLLSGGAHVAGAGAPVSTGSSRAAVAAASAGRLGIPGIAVLLGLLIALGLRDKVAFLAARPEVYGPLLIAFLFPLVNLIVAAQIVFLCIWLGAASSKLNRHFPFVVTVMISNTPWNRSRRAKALLYRNHPQDILPSWRAALSAHLGTSIEFTFPIILFLTSKGVLGMIAAIAMILFHLHITSTFPLAVPLEWNLFMIFGICFLFLHYGAVPLSSLHSPYLLAILLLCCVVVPVLGNLWPGKISFLPAMRYYARNWATSIWCFAKRSDAEQRLEGPIVKPGPIVVEQLTRLYDRDLAEFLLNKGLAFRAMHSHGRALTGLLPRATDGEVDDYAVRDGEIVSGVVNGWNFGDGHLHGLQLLQAVQERCGFAPGELRVITLESQPAFSGRQRYAIHDAADGTIEEGFVRVRDMVGRQPWLDERFDFPVEVLSSRSAPVATVAPGGQVVSGETAAPGGATPGATAAPGGATPGETAAPGGAAPGGTAAPGGAAPGGTAAPGAGAR
jgi:hypothetical protein